MLVDAPDLVPDHDDFLAMQDLPGLCCTNSACLVSTNRNTWSDITAL